jgi:hypothetical protein
MRLLRYLTDSVNQELRLRKEYLAENRIFSRRWTPRAPITTYKTVTC